MLGRFAVCKDVSEKSGATHVTYAASPCSTRWRIGWPASIPESLHQCHHLYLMPFTTKQLPLTAAKQGALRQAQSHSQHTRNYLRSRRRVCSPASCPPEFRRFYPLRESSSMRVLANRSLRPRSSPVDMAHLSGALSADRTNKLHASSACSVPPTPDRRTVWPLTGPRWRRRRGLGAGAAR